MLEQVRICQWATYVYDFATLQKEIKRNIILSFIAINQKPFLQIWALTDTNYWVFNGFNIRQIAE